MKERGLVIQPQLVVSDNLIDFAYKNSYCCIALDFTGYIINLPKKFKLSMLLDLQGRYVFFPTKIVGDEATFFKKGLKKRRAYRALKFLVKNKFLKYHIPGPFEDYENHRNIPLNKDRAVVIKEYFF